MKLYYKVIALAFFVLVTAGCRKKEFIPASGNGPVLSISKDFEKIDGANVGDEITIPVKASSQKGVKRLSYFFITKTANGTSSGQPVNIDKPKEYPQEIEESIKFKIQPDLLSLVIVSFDGDNRASQVEISVSEIRALPVLTFKGGVDYLPTYFESKRLAVEGLVTSEFDLASITYHTILDGKASSEMAVNITDKKNAPFKAEVIAKKGLTAVVVTAKNIYNGLVSDTLKIGTIVDDAVNITLAGNISAIANAYADSVNTLTGNISSGSDVSVFSYAMKVNGSYGAEQTIALGTPADDFTFSIPFNPVPATQAIRISAANAGGKTKVVEVPILKINRRLLRFSNIVLTTEIGPGKNNWFSAYKAPHVFDVTNAAANQEMIDFGTIVYSNAFRFVPPFIYTAGAGYQTAVAPYMPGFTKATYAMVTANRRSVTPAAMDTLRWDNNLENYIKTNIKGPGPIGENYNVTTTNRRISGDPVVGTGFIIGWGSWNLATSVVNNEAFGVVLVKAFTTSGSGVGTVTLDIIVPAQDVRTMFNPVSTFGYPSP